MASKEIADLTIRTKIMAEAKARIEPGTQKHRSTEKAKSAQVAAMRAKGMGWADIGRALDISVTTVKKWHARHAEIEAGSTVYDIPPRIRAAIALLEKHGYKISPPST